MKWKQYKSLLFIGGFICFISLFHHCTSSINISESQYLNHADNVAFVGNEQCSSCHNDIYKSFMKTGMGQSFHHATPQKSSAIFGPHVSVYDSINNLHYHPFFRNDSMFIVEYQLLAKDTVHKREQHVSYIVGSGQHTNSHIIDQNGYLTQAPITFYTQKGIWELAPGFDRGFSSRFNRIIGKECMTCHNHIPEMVKGSENKFTEVPLGITCERCHGPGEIHIKEKLAGNLVDTAQFIDYSIVNPGKLNRSLQLDVCERCHVQGLSVLKDGKDYDDFKPGMHLSDFMDVFLPKYSGPETKFIMASQAHRMTKSECFIKSEMTCLSCHNPHVSVTETSRETFNSKCLNCHQSEACSLPIVNRQENNDCVTCHMKTSTSIDIPNVTITDHYIRKPLSEEALRQPEFFEDLEQVTGGTIEPFTKAKAYLDFYEKFMANPVLLDSAHQMIQNISHPKIWQLQVHHFYLLQDWQKIVSLSNIPTIENIDDAWTAYRIGEAFFTMNDVPSAHPYFERSIALLPYQLDFQIKLANSEQALGQLDKATKRYQFILEEHQQYAPAWNNLGYLHLLQTKVKQAQECFENALLYNPNYNQALLNLLNLAHIKGNTQLFLQYYNRIDIQKLDQNEIGTLEKMKQKLNL